MIRKVQKEDLPECARVIKESFMTVAEQFGFTEENAPRFTAFATDEQRLLYHMEGEHRAMFAAEEDGMICGYYSLLATENGGCELSNLAVLPEHRHKGIGGQLLEHSFLTAKKLGCTVMSIGIVEENEVLRKWYEKYGAVHIGAKKFDFFPFTCGYMEKKI